MIGHLHTPEIRKKIGDANRGRRHTKEAREKMRVARVAQGLKRFCSRGHDTLIEGGRIGAGSGRCRICYTKWLGLGIVKADGSPFGFIDYDRAYQVQQGRCAGCRRHQSELPKSLCVDHDHATGVFRGLLCIDCNYALGCVKDRVEVLDQLKAYLQEPPK